MHVGNAILTPQIMMSLMISRLISWIGILLINLLVYTLNAYVGGMLLVNLLFINIKLPYHFTCASCI